MTFVVRLIVTVLLAGWLPLQSVAAVTMPFCGADHDSRAMAMEAMDHARAMDHSHHDMGHDAAAGGGSHHDLDCNQCGLCHLACASALPSTTPALSDVLQAVFQPAPAVSATLFQPDRLLRPPRG